MAEIDYYDVLREVGKCASAWEPDARLVGNVRAGDIATAVLQITDSRQITSGWLQLMGWTVFAGGTRATIQWVRDHPIQLWKKDESHWSVTVGYSEFNVISNLGDVRRLMDALGIPVSPNKRNVMSDIFCEVKHGS